MRIKCVVCMLALLSFFAQAQVAQDVRCTLQDGVWYLDNNVKIILDKEPLAALKNGVILSFLRQIEVKTTSDWFGETYYVEYLLALSYNPITLSYQVEDSMNSRAQSFSNLADALKSITTVEHQPLIMKKSFDKGAAIIRVRFKLDKEKLPSALRLDAIFSPQWQIESDWSLCH